MLYLGDEVVDIGTARELAERRGVRPETIRFYSMESYKKRVTDDSHVIAERVDWFEYAP